MKIHKCVQGEADWVLARLGKVTASELGNLLTTKFEQRTGEMPKTYLAQKIAEAWRGQPLAGFSSWATEQGQLLEDEARSFYALEFDDHKITNVGFIEGDDGKCGCSPDALLGDDGGLELKAPYAETHVKYLLNGVVPPDYVPQVHMSLYVTGRKWWRFVSYRRGFPPLVIEVKRDDAIMARIGAALETFYKAFDESMNKLRALR